MEGHERARMISDSGYLVWPDTDADAYIEVSRLSETVAEGSLYAWRIISGIFHLMYWATSGRRSIIQTDELNDEGESLRVSSFPFFLFHFSACLRRWACDAREKQRERKEEVEKGRGKERKKERKNVVNNVMKFLRRFETRRRHLRRDFMKSLNSPARKDIIKFPTAKFVLSLSLFLSLSLLPSLFISSSSGFDDSLLRSIPSRSARL